jgi:hypothetical protein
MQCTTPAPALRHPAAPLRACIPEQAPATRHIPSQGGLEAIQALDRQTPWPTHRIRSFLQGATLPR